MIYTGAETGITVNNIPAAIYGSQFIANNVPLTEGQNAITVTATDVNGLITTTQTAVTAVTTGNYITLTSNINAGIAPLEISLRVNGTFSIDNSSIDATGPLAVEFLPDSGEVDEYRIKIPGEGVYTFTVSVTGADSVVYEDTIMIAVLNKTQLDNLLRMKWNKMKEKFIIQDIEGGLNYFLEYSKAMYRQTFNVIIDELPQLIADMQKIEMIYMMDGIAKYRIKRTQEIDGVAHTITYYIYFAKDEKGVWKIDKF